MTNVILSYSIKTIVAIFFVYLLMLGMNSYALGPVVWTDLDGTSVMGNTLNSISGAGRNADAESTVEICGDGYVEIIATTEGGTHNRVMIGLNSDPTSSTNFASIDYAIYYYRVGTNSNNKRIYVYENGTNRGQFGTWQEGDIYRVERTGSSIEYKRNGVVFYTSTIQTSSELYADVSLYDVNASIGTSLIHADACQQCGNGIVEGTEACDDGNLDDGDGCNNLCIVECPTGQVPNSSGECVDLLCDLTQTTVTLGGVDVSGTQLEMGDQVEMSCDGTYAELYAMRAKPISSTTRDAFSRYTTNNPVLYTIPTSDAYDFQCYIRASGDGSGSPWATEYCGEVETVYCGNGRVEGSEECDDGDVENDDGCANDCTINDGFVCDGGSPTLCENILDTGDKSGEFVDEPVIIGLCEEAVSLSTGPIAYNEENFPHYIERLDDMTLNDIMYSSTGNIQPALDYSYLSPSCTSPGNFPGGASRPTQTTQLNAMRLTGFLNVPGTPGSPVERTIGSHVNDGLRLTIGDNQLFEYSRLTESPGGNRKQYHRVTFPEPGKYPIEILWMSNALCTIDPLEILWAPGHLSGYQDLDCYGIGSGVTHSCPGGAVSPEFSIIGGNLLTPASSCAPCGNGTIDVDEECDDGNLTSHDGCSSECKIEYCRDDAPLHDTSKNFVITDLSPTVIAGTSSQPNSEVAICFEDTAGSRDVFYTSTDSGGSFTYAPNLGPAPWVNVGVMLHNEDGLDIDHHAMVIVN